MRAGARSRRRARRSPSARCCCWSPRRWSLWAVARRPDRLTILVGVTRAGARLLRAPTRVHERYLFPFFALAAILSRSRGAGAIAYVVAARRDVPRTCTSSSRVLPTTRRSPTGSGSATRLREPSWSLTVAVVHSAAFLWGARAAASGGRDGRSTASSRRPAEAPTRRPRPDAVPATCRRTPTEPGPRAARRWRAGRRGRAGGPRRPPPPAAAPAPPPRAGAVPARRAARPGTTGPSWTEIGPDRLAPRPRREPPVRADRSAPLAHERGGRLDRLDLLVILVVLVVGGPAACARAGWPSRTGCTSTRSTTPGRRPSSSRTGATASTTTSTSGPTRTSPSTRWPRASSRSAGDDVAPTGDLGVPGAGRGRRAAPRGPGRRRATDRRPAVDRDGERARAYDLARAGSPRGGPCPGRRPSPYDDDGRGSSSAPTRARSRRSTRRLLGPRARRRSGRAGHRPVRRSRPCRRAITALEPYRGGALAAAITDDGQVVVFGMDDRRRSSGRRRSPAPSTSRAPATSTPSSSCRPSWRTRAAGRPRSPSCSAATRPSTSSVADRDRRDNLRLLGVPDAIANDDLKAAIDDGELPGVEFQPVAHDGRRRRRRPDVPRRRRRACSTTVDLAARHGLARSPASTRATSSTSPRGRRGRRP